jgi:uncharacterized protein (DUF2336 family)
MGVVAMATAGRTAERQKNSGLQSLIDQLNATMAAGSEGQRQRILTRVADLFAVGAQGYSDKQVALFDDVLQELVAEIETRARAQLAERLAHIANAPPKVIRQLAFDDEIAVAEPVLKHSEQLTDADLVENASTKSQDHLFAIAQRLKLSESVTDVLIDRGDRRVVHRMVKNKGAAISLAGYGKLTARATADQALTQALGRRSDVPRQFYLKLVEMASAEVRAKLDSADQCAAAAIRDSIDDVATSMQQESRDVSPGFASALRDANRRFMATQVTEANIHAPARAQEFERTAIALAKLGRLPIDLVERALLDKGEERILIIAKAAGCSWTTTRELLLMRVAGRDMKPRDLERAYHRYEKLTKDAARKIVAEYGQRAKRRASGVTVEAEAVEP